MSKVIYITKLPSQFEKKANLTDADISSTICTTRMTKIYITFEPLGGFLCNFGTGHRQQLPLLQLDMEYDTLM